MPLEKQILTFRPGDLAVDTGTALQLTRGLMRAQNAVYHRGGALRKRFGMSRGDQVVTTPLGIAPLGAAALVLIDGNDLKPANGAGQSRGVTKDCPIITAYPRRVLSSQTEGVYTCETETLGNVIATAFLEYSEVANTYSLQLYVHDRSSGHLLASQTLASGGASVRTAKFASIGGALLVYYWNTDDAFYYRTINTTTGTIGSASSISLPVTPSLNAYFDLCVLPGTGTAYVYVVYKDINLDISWLSLSNGTSVSYSGSFTGITCSRVSCWTQGALDAGIVFGDDITSQTHIKVMSKTETGAAGVIGPQVLVSGSNADPINLCGVATGANTARVMWTGDVSGSDPYTEIWSVGATSSTLHKTWQRTHLLAKPIRHTSSSSTYYAFVGIYDYNLENIETSIQRRALIIDENEIVVGQFAPGVLAMTTESNRACFCLPTTTTGGNICDYMLAVPLLTRDSLEDWRGRGNEFDIYTIARVEIDTSPSPPTMLEGEGIVHIPSSLPRLYDGTNCVEEGFLWYPSNITATSVAGSGVETGTHQYAAMYEWVDARGGIHRSAPSPLKAVEVTAGNNKVNVVVPTLLWTLRDSVRIVIYRSEANGSVLYRVGSTPNSLTADTVTFADTTPDTTINTREILYTQTGEVENISPAQHLIACWHQRRYVYVDLERPDTDIRYSKVPVGIAIEHTDLLRLTVPADGGPIIALTSRRDRLFVWKRDRVLVIEGEGKSSTLAGAADYLTPTVAVTGVGCIERRMIVDVPQGQMFLAPNGIKLLTDGFAVEPVGRPVIYWTENYDYTSAVVVQRDELALFFSTQTGAETLAFNTREGKWSTWTTSEQIWGACIVSSVPFFVSASGYVWHIDADNPAFQDNSLPFNVKIETPWFTLADHGGRFRLYEVQLIGHRLAACVLNVRFAYDFITGWPALGNGDYRTHTPGTTAFGPDTYMDGSLNSATYDTQESIVRFAGTRQSVRSFRLQIEVKGDAAVSGEDYTLSAIVLVVGMKRGQRRAFRFDATAA